MKTFILSIALLVGVIILHPFVRYWVPLAQLIPLLVVFWGWKLKPVEFVVLTLCGGFMNDLIVGDTLGFTPLIWAILIFITRTQIPWLEMYGYGFALIVGFAGTVIYLVLSRLAFMAHYRIWDWNTNLTSQIFLSALLNALLCPVLFLILRPMYDIVRERPGEAVTLSHVHS